MKTINEIIEAINNENARSAWDKGIKEYAVMIIENFNDGDFKNVSNRKELEKILLNGADTWNQYSYGGCALICDTDIAETLCTPSELKRKKGGELQPNNHENWLDVQTRALKQAFSLIYRKAF